MGKSSVTTQLALSLSLAGHSVGILDVDLTGPSIPRLLGIESAKVKQAPGGWLPVEVHQSQTLQPVPTPSSPSSHATTPSNGANNGGPPAPSVNQTAPRHPDHINVISHPQPTLIGSLQAMSLAFLLTTRSSAIVWRGPKKTAMVRQFLDSVLWPSLDYLLIDTPPGTSDEHISLVETLLQTVSPADAPKGPHLAGAVIVTTPQAVAISDVRKEINFCGKVGVKVIGVVENMSGYVCECCGVGTNLFSKGGGEIMSREFGVKFLGSVPLDGQWGVLIEEGRRPRYGTTNVPVGSRGEEAEEEEEKEPDEEKREEGLLIDKYRSCSLCPIFEGIARQIVDTVTEGTAVSVRALNV